MEIVVLFLVLAVLAVLTPRFGVDSRSFDPQVGGGEGRSRSMVSGSTEDRRSAPSE